MSVHRRNRDGGTVLSSLLLVILVASAAPAPAANPLEPALSGQLQCYEPDEKNKTCRALGSYKLVSDTHYINTAVFLLDGAGPVTVEITTSVDVRDGELCG